MNLAISSPYATTVVSAVSSCGVLVASFIAAFVGVGWTVQAAITGGSTLQGTSPQGYVVWLDIWAIDASTCGLKLHSAVSACVGYAHQIHWDVSYAWQVITHPCGWFISRPLVGPDVQGSACCGGIPMIAADCGLATAIGAVTEAWFSFGDYIGSPFFYGRNPRLNIDVGDTLYGVVTGNNATGCWDGAMAAPVTGWDPPEILRFSPAAPDDVGGSLAFDSHPLFYGGAALTYPAFIAWPSASGGPVQVRGQIYNAAVQSATMIRGATAMISGYSAVSYTDSYFWGSLLVLITSGAGGGGSGTENVQY